jgi:hypothetical protein
LDFVLQTIEPLLVCFLFNRWGGQGMEIGSKQHFGTNPTSYHLTQIPEHFSAL